MSVVLNSDIPGLSKQIVGKVRDVYDLGDVLLILTTDRISAFDVVLPNGIPDKGRVLNQLSRYWFLHLRSFVPNHYITADVNFILSKIHEAGTKITDSNRESLRGLLSGRSMLALKTKPLPVECVVRGYLAGSFWHEYCAAGGPDRAVEVHGIRLPSGLRESDRLPEPIFTPSTKEKSGHDRNIGMAEMARMVENDVEHIASVSLSLYKNASDRAARNGIIIADTKFEFGYHHSLLMLIDEALTPDSSRFWDAATYEPGRSQPSFDKQYVRDWLDHSGWNHEPPPPQLPDEVVRQTSEKYRLAYRRLVGEALGEGV